MLLSPVTAPPAPAAKLLAPRRFDEVPTPYASCAFRVSVCSNVLVWPSTVTIVGAAVSPQTKGMHLIWITPLVHQHPRTAQPPTWLLQGERFPNQPLLHVEQFMKINEIKLIWEGNNSILAWDGGCVPSSRRCVDAVGREEGQHTESSMPAVAIQGEEDADSTRVSDSEVWSRH